jgi:hypothetical protein
MHEDEGGKEGEYDRMTVTIAKERCIEFLKAYFGSQGTPAASDDEKRRFGLRLICLGNAERTVQGELVHYLRSGGFNAVSECGTIDGTSRNSVDVIIFDDDWTAVCAIELKHYSANQGRVDALIFNMEGDAIRHYDGPQKLLPLIQIGLYSEISTSFEKATYLPAFGLYRFLVSYFRGKPKQTIEGQLLPPHFHGQLIAPGMSDISLDGVTVVGRVGWIVRAAVSSPS